MHTVEANCEPERGVGTNIRFGSVFQQDSKDIDTDHIIFPINSAFMYLLSSLPLLKSDTFSHLVAWQPHLFATAVGHVFPVLER